MEQQLESFPGDLKVHMFPEDKNQILIRIENLADLFDSSLSETPHINVKKYAENLYANMNGKKHSNMPLSKGH